nr:translation initiation factor IF-2-like [Equus asinus]
MTPQRLFYLMSTHVKEIATLSHCSGALDWDPPRSPQPGSRTDGAWSQRPSPAAGGKLQPPAGKPAPVREGGSSRGPGREAAGPRQLPARLSPPPAGPTPRPGPPGPPPSSARPLGDPQPSGSRSRLRAEELRPGAGPGWAQAADSSARGSPGRLMPQARRPPPPGAQPLTCRRRRRSTLLPGGAPTRPGCGPLRSPPGQARGGAGASPERRNPPPRQPPPAPGSTRGRAGEGGRGGRRSPGSRTEPGARRGPGPGRPRGARDRPPGAGQRPREAQEGPGRAGRRGPARLGATRVRRGGRGGRNRWCPGPASGPLIRIGSVRISSDRCKHTSETACFLARFARLGGRGGPGGVGEEPTVGEEGEGTRKVGGSPLPRRPASSNQRPGWRAGVNQGTPRGEGGRRLAGRLGAGGRAAPADGPRRGGRSGRPETCPARSPGAPEPRCRLCMSGPGQGGRTGILGRGPALEGPRRPGQALPACAWPDPAPA